MDDDSNAGIVSFGAIFVMPIFLITMCGGENDAEKEKRLHREQQVANYCANQHLKNYQECVTEILKRL